MFYASISNRTVVTNIINFEINSPVLGDIQPQRSQQILSRMLLSLTIVLVRDDWCVALFVAQGLLMHVRDEHMHRIMFC